MSLQLPSSVRLLSTKLGWLSPNLSSLGQKEMQIEDNEDYLLWEKSK